MARPGHGCGQVCPSYGIDAGRVLTVRATGPIRARDFVHQTLHAAASLKDRAAPQQATA